MSKANGAGRRGVEQPTMADIAAHLGVSRPLVSIVLRDMPGASEDTRKRVLAAAAELGYSPHQAARSLRQTESRLLGVVFSPSNATEPDIVEAIYPAAAAEGYRVALSAETPTRDTRRALSELVEYRCAAIIIIGSAAPAREIRTFAEQVRIPVVTTGAGSRNTAYDVVRSAGDKGIEQATRHLLELGHRSLTFVHAPAMPSSKLRMRGYSRALESAGLTEDVVTIGTGEYAEEAGADAARTLLARTTLPTGIVLGNDQQAIGAMQVLARRGISVPNQVSLTAFDDSRLARLSSADLTSATQDPVAMGRAAVAAALKRIADPAAKPSLTVVPSTLVVRGSSGVPRST